MDSKNCTLRVLTTSRLAAQACAVSGFCDLEQAAAPLPESRNLSRRRECGNSQHFLFHKSGELIAMPQQDITEQDLFFLRRAIELALEARNDGRHPFGALIVNERGETIVAARNNAVRPKGDPTQHAELVACSEAARLLPEAELAKCTLYTSTEPCAMCAGAIYWTGVGRVVFALAETGLLNYTGNDKQNPTLDLPCREVFARGQKRIAVAGPLLEEEAGKVHEGFWLPC